jgi:phosphate uptake regulator
MTEDRPFAVQGLHFTGIAHNLERVADQATNICLERVADQATNICEDIVSMIRDDSP